jgi:hypothetical protein
MGLVEDEVLITKPRGFRGPIKTFILSVSVSGSVKLRFNLRLPHGLGPDEL